MEATPPDHSESGSPIYRHQPRKRPFDLAIGDDALIEAVESHVQATVGPIETVWHEIVSDLVHLDILVVAPSVERPFHTLVTCGMSTRPMTVPEGAEEFRYAELALCLPQSWPLDAAAFKDEANYWPIRLLKTLARLPHEYETWLGWGHTVPNGDPSEPYAAGTALCGAMLAEPMLLPAEFVRLEVGDGRTVLFYTVLGLHADEMDLKLGRGAEALLKRLGEAGVTERVDPARPSVVKRRWWGGLA